MGYCKDCGEILTQSKCRCGGVQTETTSGLDGQSAHYSDQYIPSGLRGGVESGLKSMLGMDNNNPKNSLNDVIEKCKRCKQSVTGNAVSLNEFVFHYDCLLCDLCDSKLDTSKGITIVKDSVLCTKCVHSEKTMAALGSMKISSQEKTKSNSSLNTNTTQPPKSSKTGTMTVVNDQGLDKCKFCLKALGTTEPMLQISATEIIHASCLKCKACHKTIDNNAGFAQLDGAFYHGPCLNGPTANCGTCKLPITGTGVAFEENKYHQEVFHV